MIKNINVVSSVIMEHDTQTTYLSAYYIEYRKGNVMTKNKIKIVIFNTKINNISDTAIQIVEINIK